MVDQVLYQTSATASGAGRDGRSEIKDGPKFNMITPKALGGAGGDGVNPEQLFAAGYASCFLSALRFHAGQKKAALPADTRVKVDVGIGPNGEGGFGLSVTIGVEIPGLDRTEAQALVDGAHAVCPYSNATRGALSITPKLL